jgi:Mg2+ and Co2+ transporter CorA
VTAPETARDRAPGDGPEIRARRFDADRRDQVLSFEEALDNHPTERQLLWLDIHGDLPAEDSRRLAERFELEDRTVSALESQETEPFIAMNGRYAHVRVAAEPDSKTSEVTWLDVVAGRDLVITSHDRPIGFLNDFDERIEADTSLGTLSAATFLATLLDAATISYLQAVDGIEDEIDVLDTRSLRDAGRDDLLDHLVQLRRRIARLRRRLAAHRSLFAALASPDVAVVAGDEEGARALAASSERFDRAMAAVEDSRDVLLGSFDVFMTRTAQRTNEVMKVLTLATVLLLPGSMIAGLLGMNVIVPLNKDDPMSFWLVVGAIVVLAIGIVAVAKRRSWL